MAKILPYNRSYAVLYANEWASARNPIYYDYTQIGGDCTNYVSQCLFAGSGIMNYDSPVGWYYVNPNLKSPSWTGVEFLYEFLIFNKKRGVFAREVGASETQPGDVAQIANSAGRFYHSLFVSDVVRGTIYINAHSNNTLRRRLSSYNYTDVRYLHIMGVLV